MHQIKKPSGAKIIRIEIHTACHDGTALLSVYTLISSGIEIIARHFTYVSDADTVLTIAWVKYGFWWHL